MTEINDRKPEGLPDLIRHYIDGQSVDSVDGDTFDVLEPVSNEVYVQAAAGKKGVPAATAQQQPAAADATTAPAAPASDGQIRTVGPTFIQQKKQ